MITGKNYIGNVLASTGKKTFKTFNPQANQENDIVFTEVSDLEIEITTTLATEAFKTFKTISGAKKSKFLYEIANQITALGDELIEIYCSESGLSKERAIS